MNPYKVLQVDREAEPEVIEAAYKRLASKYHPDKDPSASATGRMQGINAAFEILKDPERRREYDSERLRTEGEAQRTQAPATRSREPAIGEVPSGVLKMVLWTTAFVALVVYFPWGVAILIGLWGLIWLNRRFPKKILKAVKLAMALTVGAGAFMVAYVSLRDVQQEQLVKAELRKLSGSGMFNDNLTQFTNSCVSTASRTAPAIANAYCACLAEAVRVRFDHSPINARTANEYSDAFISKFQEALPSQEAQSMCWQQVQPKYPSVPAAVPGMAAWAVPWAVPVNKKAKRAPTPSAPSTFDIDPVVQDVLIDRLRGAPSAVPRKAVQTRTSSAPSTNDIDPAVQDALIDRFRGAPSAAPRKAVQTRTSSAPSTNDIDPAVQDVLIDRPRKQESQ